MPHSRLRVLVLLTAAVAVAGCGGDDSTAPASESSKPATSPSAFAECFGITIYGSADEVLTEAVENVALNTVYDGSMGSSGGDRPFAITDDEAAARSADDGDAAEEIGRLVWDNGYGGGSGRGAGGTDQTALVLIPEAGDRDKVVDLVEQMYRPVFAADAEDEEIGWDEFRSKHILTVGDSVIVVDTNPDGFTKRVRRSFDECAGA